MANIIPLPKINPPMLIEKDFIPISLTPQRCLKPVDGKIDGELDSMQFGGISGTSTTDVLVKVIHIWYEATDK